MSPTSWPVMCIFYQFICLLCSLWTFRITRLLHLLLIDLAYVQHNIYQSFHDLLLFFIDLKHNIHMCSTSTSIISRCVWLINISTPTRSFFENINLASGSKALTLTYKILGLLYPISVDCSLDALTLTYIESRTCIHTLKLENHNLVVINPCCNFSQIKGKRRWKTRRNLS